MDIELPNGYVIQDVPEGTSKQEIMDKAIKAGFATAADFGAPQEVQRGRPTMANDPRIITDTESRPSNESWLSKKFGDITRTSMTPNPTEQSGYARGLMDPIMGVAQLGAQALGNESMSQQERAREAQYQEARAARGDTGFDVGRLAGNVVNPINYVAPEMAGASALTRSAVTGGALAATQPVYGENFWEDKALQVAVGASLGPLVEYGVKGASKLLDSFKGLTKEGREQAVQDWLKTLVDPKDQEKVVRVLREVQPIVPGSKPTALEALADTPEGALIAAAQEKIGRTTPTALIRQGEQEAARQAQLAPIAGTPEQRAAVEAARTATGETREAALGMADTVKTAVDDIQKNVMGEANRIVNQRGSAIISGEGVPVTDLLDQAKQKVQSLSLYQQKALADNGFFPLEVKGVIKQIDSAIKGTDSDLSKSVLEMAKAKILSKADENGFISSADLYENVRKTLNQDIQALLTQANKPAQGGIPEQAAKAAGNVKNFVDAALNKSSNGLWRKYIDGYSANSAKLNRMAIGEELQKKLGTSLANKERAGAFANAVQEASSLIKKATGFPRYKELSQVLTPEEIGAVNRVLADLQRLEKGKTMAGSVNVPAYAPEPPLQGVNLLSRSVTIAKEALQYLARGSKEDFEKKVIELTMDPQALATFLQAGPITGQRKLIDAMNKKLSERGQQIFLQAVTVSDPARTAGE